MGIAKETFVWSETRGAGEPLLLYLHGLNATGAVWERLDALAAASWPGRRMIIDLPGHGRSGWMAEYSYGAVAARIAAEVPNADSVTIIGHSMGGVLALTLASGWFGMSVGAVLAFGVKVNWTEEELAKALAISERPPKRFTERTEAVERFLLLAGLGQLIEASDPIVETGIRELDGGLFRLAADPRVAGIGAPAMASLIAVSQAPVRMACGTNDPLVSVEELRAFDVQAEQWTDVGHNAQLEAAQAVWSTFDRLSPLLTAP